ncbi:MAG: tRNA (adenosine(37)-N6)-threonylcarbamoyltransferase complex dimerization subunit type 1 TsaB [Myxococcota bacterium]
MTRYVLAMDTATPMQTLALIDGEDVVVRAERRVRYDHSSTLLSAVDAALSERKLTVADLDLIVCGLGPGSFTGLRVGLSIAKGLARAAGVPIVGASTLAAIAHRTAITHPGQPIAAAIDARRGELYAGIYQWGDGALQNLLADCAMKERVLRDAILERTSEAQPGWLLGHNTGSYEALKDFEGTHVTALAPRWVSLDPVGLALLGRAHFEAEGAADLRTLEPNYVRPSDAERTQHVHRSEDARNGHGGSL